MRACLPSIFAAFTLISAAPGCLEPPADVPWDASLYDAAQPDAEVVLDDAELTANEDPRMFGDVTVGGMSDPIDVVVVNTGEQPSGALSITLTGDTDDFAIVPTGGADDCFGAILDPQESCKARVQFAPDVAGARSAQLAVVGDPGGMIEVALSGNGLTPGDLDITVGEDLAFGPVEITLSSTAQMVTVENTGDTTTANLTVMVGDPTSYGVSNDTCNGVPLGAGLTCSFMVTFHPTTVGSLPTQISVRESPTVGVAAMASGTGTARVQVTPPTGGTITSSGGELNCGATCGPVSFDSSPVTLTATPNAGGTFEGWTGLCAGTLGSTCSLALTTPLATVGAAFDNPVYSVGGSVNGMWDGVSIELRLQAPGVDETKTLPSNGPFSFDAALVNGNAFQVTIATQPAQHSCSVTNGAGNISGASVTNVAVNCTGPVVGASLSLPVALSFNSAQTTYSLAVSRLAQQTSVRVTAPTATQIIVSGSVVASGAWSPPISLSSGPNTISFTVTVGTASRTYGVSINRGAAAIAQHAYVKASNTGPDDNFGAVVALDGDVMVIGAAAEDSSSPGVNGTSNENAAESGAAYIFRRTGATWVQEAYVKASNPGANDQFGGAVAVSGDTVVVGARLEDGPGDASGNSGAAYVFRWNGSAWSQEAYLRASDAAADSGFGVDVAISGDSVLIGAPGLTFGGAPGAVYAFRRTGTTWAQEQKVQRQTPANGDNFGARVAISGALGIVGGGSFAGGEVRIIRRIGSIWSVEATYSNGAYTFPTSLAINADRAAIGDSGDGAFQGAVHIKRYSGALWGDEVTLRATGGEDYDSFGSQVSWFGQHLVVGANAEASDATGVDGDSTSNAAPRSGAAYLFTRVGTSWTQDAYFKASNTGADDYFGACFVTGDAISCGAPSEDSAAIGVGGDQTSNAASASGAVYVFR